MLLQRLYAGITPHPPDRTNRPHAVRSQDGCARFLSAHTPVASLSRLTSRSVAVLLTLAFAVSLLPSHAGAQGQAQEQDQRQESGQPAPGFADVPDAHVFGDQIAWLAATGISRGRDEDTITTAEAPDLYSHTYRDAGRYTVVIYGLLTRFGSDPAHAGVESIDRLVSVAAWAEPLEFIAFAGAINLGAVPEDLPRTVTNMDRMFAGATSFDQDLPSWNGANGELRDPLAPTGARTFIPASRVEDVGRVSPDIYGTYAAEWNLRARGRFSNDSRGVYQPFAFGSPSMALADDFYHYTGTSVTGLAALDGKAMIVGSSVQHSGVSRPRVRRGVRRSRR